MTSVEVERARPDERLDAEVPADTPRRRRLGRVFPGDRAVWLAAGVVAAVLGVILLVALLQPRTYFLGSNSVAARTSIAEIKPGERICSRGVQLPAGTGRVRYQIDTVNARRGTLSVKARLRGGEVLRGTLPGTKGPAGFAPVDIPLDRTVPGGADFQTADICLKSAHGSPSMFLWGQQQLDLTTKPLLVGKNAVLARPALWYLPLAHEQRSIVRQFPQIFERASLFRPGFQGPWVFWLLMLAGMPLLIYAAIRLIATADSGLRRRVPLAVAVALVAFGAATSWALVNPAFQSPDESEHFAYTQYLAETGRAVDLTPGQRPVWSSEEGFAIDATHDYSVIEHHEAKLPWLEETERDYHRRLAKTYPDGAARDNGGGYHPATSVHSPAYYALLVPGYLIGKGSVFGELFGMRLISALMGALTAMFAFLIVSELLPRRRGLAVAAGLMVGLEPMFAFVSGAVNNDNGVNLACAAIIYLMVRSLRRGMTWPVAAGLGAALVVAPLMKGTGYELYPPVMVGLVGLVARRHGRRDLAMLAVVAGAFALAFLGWDALRGTFHRDAFTTPGGATPGVSFGAKEHIKGYLSWLWQVLVPYKLPFMQDFTIIRWPFFNVYIERGFAGFGWYAIFFPHWVYGIITGVLALLGVLGLRFAWLVRARWREWLPEALFLVSVPVVVIAAVEAAYFTLQIPLDGTPEQGRYAFPAITAVAALAIGGCLGLGRKRALPAATALVTALGMLLLAGQFLTLSSFYS